jgi:L-ascorbate 6-phosphate lactonase
MNLTMQTLKEFMVPAGSLAVWWLGQAGFLVKTSGGTLAAIDPYLSDSCGSSAQASAIDFFRKYPPILNPGDLAGIDGYMMTHSHQDHLDPETLAGYRQAGGQGPFVAPAEAAEKLLSLGVVENQIIRMHPNKRCTIGDLNLQATLAIPYGEDDLTHVGYLVSTTNGPTFYFTGDTAYHEVIGLTVSVHNPDVMFTVINGTFRNLSPAEAAQLAWQIQPKVVIPYHYDLFPDGQMPPRTLWMNLLLHEMQERYQLLTPGEVWVYPM